MCPPPPPTRGHVQGADILKFSDADLLALLGIKLSMALINPGVVRAGRGGRGGRMGRVGGSIACRHHQAYLPRKE